MISSREPSGSRVQAVTSRQSGTLARSRSVQVPRRGHEVQSIDELARVLAHHHDGPMAERTDIVGSAAAGQSGDRVLILANDRGVEIAIRIDHGRTKEAIVDVPGLAEGHHIVHTGSGGGFIEGVRLPYRKWQDRHLTG